MIKYIEGDLFPGLDRTNEVVILPHIVNSIYAWGSGFVVPLAKHYPNTRVVYKAAESLPLGTNQFVEINNLTVVNMIAQERIGYSNGMPPIRYEALQECMNSIAEKVRSTSKKVTIVCPMFGSGLAGGDWNKIEQMIKDTWGDFDVRIHYFADQIPANWSLPNE